LDFNENFSFLCKFELIIDQIYENLLNPIEVTKNHLIFKSTKNLINK